MGCDDRDGAVFWCSLLNPVRPREIPKPQRGRYFRSGSEPIRRMHFLGPRFF
ncbi:MAG: hypothetical protein GX575_31865 [Candidatus Anammoximicrobium sp.]|nr:hypothetical protein [Candidatus Anammoximicrobium sp.]